MKLKTQQHTQSYNAEIVAGSLLIPESRIIAQLLLDETDEDTFQRKIMVENVLQKRSPAAAKRQAKLIQNRLELMTPELWEIIANNSLDIAIHAILAASIKHSHLLGDFMDRVIREHWRTFKRQISTTDWNDYWAMCMQADPEINEWSEKTKAKLRQVVFRILAEAKYFDSSRFLNLRHVNVVPEVRTYLINNNEDYVLRCMEVTQ